MTPTGDIETEKLHKAADNNPGKRKYGSVHWLVPEDSELYSLQQMLGQMIPDEKLAAWGREIEPHITLRYGLLDNEYSELIPYLQNLQPFEAKLGELMSFPPSDHSDLAAPIIFRIESNQLHVVNAELTGVAIFNPSDFDSFQPHLSVAYVKPEYAAEIVDELSPLVRMLFEGKPFMIDNAVISPATGQGDKIKIAFGSEEVELLKYSDDEDRDEHGRWSSGSSEDEKQAEGLRTLATFTPDRSGQIEVGSLVGIAEMHLHEDDEPEEWSGKNETVSVSDIHMSDEVQSVYADKVKEYILHPSNVRVELIRDRNGRLFIQDGNHRVTAAVMRGEKEIKAFVLRPPKSEKLLKAGKKKLTADPTKRTKIKAAAEAQIEQATQNAFSATAEDLAQAAEAWYAEGASADAIAEQMSLSAFDANIPEIVADALAPVMAEAAADQFSELGITDDALFDTINTEALDYAQARGAELVGRKWVGGKLVDNPDAKWAISQTTRDGIRGLVSRGYTEGWTPRDLGQKISNAYQFSPERAKLIAITETNRASSQGILSGWRNSGLVAQKEWNLSADHDFDDECDGNEDDGPIDIDDTFSSGDDGPPAHPGCTCSLSAVLATGEEEDEE